MTYVCGCGYSTKSDKPEHRHREAEMDAWERLILERLAAAWDEGKAGETATNPYREEE
jgi:hypothetical protein